MNRYRCPTCGKEKALWRENNGMGCPGENGDRYCSQRCAGRVD